MLLSQFTSAIEAQVHTRPVGPVQYTIIHECLEHMTQDCSRGMSQLRQLGTSQHRQGGAAKLAGGADGAWALPIGAAVLGVRHMGLGGWQQQECMAVENELSAWQRMGELSSCDNALRCVYPEARGVGCDFPIYDFSTTRYLL